jgi:nicotinamidase-related amidase
MAAPLTIDRAHTAVLAMDCQSGLVSIFAKDAGLIPNAARVLEFARAAGMPVIHIRVGFRPGLPEVSMKNPLFAAVKSNPQHQQLFQGPAGDVHPALGPETDDIVIVKHRVSAFTGTDLAMILRAREIETLVLFGIATSGVVLATLMEACDNDFQVVVVRDCCADLNPDIHACLLDKFFPLRGAVVTAEELLAAIP